MEGIRHFFLQTALEPTPIISLGRRRGRGPVAQARSTLRLVQYERRRSEEEGLPATQLMREFDQLGATPSQSPAGRRGGDSGVGTTPARRTGRAVRRRILGGEEATGRTGGTTATLGRPGPTAEGGAATSPSPSRTFAGRGFGCTSSTYRCCCCSNWWSRKEAGTGGAATPAVGPGWRGGVWGPSLAC